MVIGDLILQGNEILKKSGIQSHSLDTCILLCSYLGVGKLYLLTNKDVRVPDADGFFDMVKRRAGGEPVAYITGKCEFMSLEFDVTRDVLIPRPETEILVESIIKFAGGKPLTMLEIGTGSGCIAISCGYYCKNLAIDSVDACGKAVAVARRNARKHKVGNVSFFQNDILSFFPSKEYDIVASNPPYVKSGDIPGLMKDVRDYEPKAALDGGEDGLLFYRVIAKNAKAKKLIAFEVGYGQSKPVCDILNENGYENIEVLKDLAGIERVVSAKVQG